MGSSKPDPSHCSHCASLASLGALFEGQRPALSCRARTETAHAAIVIIDDHPEHLDYLAILLRHAGYLVAAFDKAQAALNHVARSSVDSSSPTCSMPDIDGIEVLRSLSRSFPDLPVIAVSDMGPRSQPLFFGMMRRLGARATFFKSNRSTMRGFCRPSPGWFAPPRKSMDHADKAAPPGGSGRRLAQVG
jgi:CheY-like chemotaxis protein